MFCRITKCATVVFSLMFVLQTTAHALDDRVRKYVSRLPDDELIKLTASVYKTDPNGWADEVSKSIALERLQAIAGRRQRSAAVKSSGILEYKYERTDIKSWPKVQLEDLYYVLRKKHMDHGWKAFRYLTARDKAVFFIREIAMEAVSELISPKPRYGGGFRGSWWQ